MKSLGKFRHTNDGPASEWSLDARIRDEGAWDTIYSGPSSDACKSFARRFRGGMPGGNKIAFRIYTPDGRLSRFALPSGSWRIRWIYGGLKTREGQVA